MASTLQAAWRAVHTRSQFPSIFLVSRSFSDGGGSRRYVSDQGFVADEGFQQDQWPPPQPPTHGGFVPHSVESYAQAPIPPTQGGFVPHSVETYAQAPIPPTQGGFVHAPPPPPPPAGYTYQQEVLPPHYIQGQTSFQPQPVYGNAYPYGQENVNYFASQGVFVPPPVYGNAYPYGQENVNYFASQGVFVPPPPPPPPPEAETRPVQEVDDSVKTASAEGFEPPPPPPPPEAETTAVQEVDDSVRTASAEGFEMTDDSHNLMSEEGSSEEGQAEPMAVQDAANNETSKESTAASTSSPGESFLDILAKANLNIRQNKPRPQLGLRSQRKTYARLHNLPRQILKSDVINYFSELNLQKENIHVTYDEKFYPLYVQIAFDSSEAMRNAQKILQTKGRFGGRVVRMEQFVQFAPPSHAQISDNMKEYLGQMLLMLHLPQEGKVEDLERFFDGYGYDPAALSMLEPVNMTLARFPKEGNRPVRRAAIGFHSSLEAMRALREKQGDFMLNEPVELRLIQ